jgi:phospholipid/cholesterol/gamma-HCH transport system substrate-binding protein
LSSGKLNISKEARVGLIVTAGLVMFYFGYNFLKGKNIFSTSRTYYAVFDNVDQLLPSAAVQLNGFRVGVVDRIQFAPNSYKVVVRLVITEDHVKLPENSEAHIVSDLLGTRTLQLTMGNAQKLADPGDTLISVRDLGITDEIKNAIMPIKKQVESLAGSIDTVLKGFNNVFNRKTQDGLSSSFASINNSILRLEHAIGEVDVLVTEERRKLSQIFTNLRSITENFEKNNDKLTNVFTNLDKITDDVAKSNVNKTFSDLQQAIGQLNAVLAGIERGEGSLGQLAKNDSLYNNLESSSKNLSLLLEDLRLHPKRYVQFSVFGRKDKSTKN